MNHMEKFAKMIGVEVGTEFGLTNHKNKKFLISHVALTHKNHESENWNMTPAYIIKEIVYGDCKVIKIPWEPKFDVIYYFIEYDEEPYVNYKLWEESSFDFALYYCGNCFKTSKEISDNMLIEWKIFCDNIKPKSFFDWSKTL